METMGFKEMTDFFSKYFLDVGRWPHWIDGKHVINRFWFFSCILFLLELMEHTRWHTYTIARPVRWLYAGCTRAMRYCFPCDEVGVEHNFWCVHAKYRLFRGNLTMKSVQWKCCLIRKDSQIHLKTRRRLRNAKSATDQCSESWLSKKMQKCKNMGHLFIGCVPPIMSNHVTSVKLQQILLWFSNGSRPKEVKKCKTFF